MKIHTHYFIILYYIINNIIINHTYYNINELKVNKISIFDRSQGFKIFFDNLFLIDTNI